MMKITIKKQVPITYIEEEIEVEFPLYFVHEYYSDDCRYCRYKIIKIEEKKIFEIVRETWGNAGVYRTEFELNKDTFNIKTSLSHYLESDDWEKCSEEKFEKLLKECFEYISKDP